MRVMHMEWKPISTAPEGVPIEVAAFPHVSHTPNITIMNNRDAMRAVHPEWTHWRPATNDTWRDASKPR